MRDPGMSTVSSAPAAGRRTAPPGQQWYAQDTTSVARETGVDVRRGLSTTEAAGRLRRDGPNELPEEKPRSGLRRFLDQYTSYMQLILVAAAIVSLAIAEWSTAILLIVITLINAAVGLRQEGQAESAMNALKSMMRESARVRRDGIDVEVPAEELVVGDVVLITAGDQVPADGRIVEASALQIDESALTGESAPVAKDARTLPAGEQATADQSDMAFMHTPVTHGTGVLIVTATGAVTEVGRIAQMLTATKAEQTPLSRQMNSLTLWIIAAAGFTMLVMFVLGIQRGEAWDTVFTAAVALAVSAIPEALPTVVQVVLSLGSVELAKRKAIVKDLPSVETLGFTSAINSDKTGTLTMNQVTAVELVTAKFRYPVTGRGYGWDGAITHPAGSTESIENVILPYVLANDAQVTATGMVGDPTERALLVLAHKAGMDTVGTQGRLPRLATLPFDPQYKLMAAFSTATNSAGETVVRCDVKGAAPAVIGRAASASSSGAAARFAGELAANIKGNVLRMERAGLKVMAAATREIDPAKFDPAGDLVQYLQQLELTSLVGLLDPPREESKAAVEAAQAAHIRVRMVTGDDVTTGTAIARQLGIPGEAILGADFAALSDEQRAERIDEIGVVGRVAPEHKVLLAETLKRKGEVVAMTGDGVNDAPAIKAADIGIAMGSGTEVAKNAGRMILSDDNFATIVDAVEQGRKLYDNLNKYIRFVLILLVAFVLTFLGASLFNIAAGQPFTPAQVLWIHFVVNAPFGIALGFDAQTSGLMSRLPRPRGDSVLTVPLRLTAGLVGLFMAATSLALIELGIHRYGSTGIGSSTALVAFVLMLIVAAYECRSETETVLRTDSFNSARMNWTALAELAGAFLITQSDFMRGLLGTTRLTARQWGFAFAAGVALLLVWEAAKWIARRRTRRAVN
jgi:P-type Ca2+ transporter type 2C